MNSNFNNNDNYNDIDINNDIDNDLKSLTTSTKEQNVSNKLVKLNIMKRKSIQELFINYSDKYIPCEIDYGNIVGKEIW